MGWVVQCPPPLLLASHKEGGAIQVDVLTISVAFVDYIATSLFIKCGTYPKPHKVRWTQQSELLTVLVGTPARLC